MNPASKPTSPKSIAEKEAEARKDSVLLKFAYHTTPTKGRMLPKQYSHVRPELLAIFEELVESAAKYKRITGRHLPILGELGELFAEIMFGIKRHGPMAQGSDGRLGKDLVEVKTITPDKKNDTVQVKRSGDFVNLIVVKITDDFQFGARMVHRRILRKGKGEFDEISWADMIAGEPDQELHRGFPLKNPAPKSKVENRLDNVAPGEPASVNADARNWYEKGRCHLRAGEATEASGCFCRAAELGDDLGQHWRGLCFFAGWGVEADIGQAVNWLVKAARQGNGESMNLLGVFYTESYAGLQKDLPEAYKWFKLAEGRGNRFAPGWLKTLQCWMTPQEEIEGERRIREFNSSE